jgi:hypothetical protein
MWIRRASVALFLGLLLTAANSAFVPRGAEAGSHVFTVTGVRVDVTAETAAAAREAAHAEGHVKAMAKLLARLLPRTELGSLRPLEAPQILAYVRDFSVGHERTSDVRYLAELTFRFRPGPVRELLRYNGLQHAETMSKPVVVLPIFGAGDEAVLWGEGNPWWATWAARPPGGWLVPLIVPLGDLGDLAAVDAARALNGDAEALGAIARRYGAEDVLITQSVLLGDPVAGLASLQVGTVRLGRYAQQTTIDTYRQPAGGKLAELLEVKRRLAGVAAVRGTEVTALSRSKTEMAITFVGGEEQLVLAMAQSDLNLALNPGVGWELRLAGSAPPEAPAPGATPEPEAAAAPAAQPDVPAIDAPMADAPMADAPVADPMNAPSIPTAE